MSYKYLKRILSLIMVITVIAVSTITVGAPSFATSFSDVENHWAKSYIETISTYNLVSGYPNGTFKPNDNIKRIEFITIMVNSQGIDTRIPKAGEFWGQPIIEAAIKNGLITLNEYGNMDELTFNKNISREEMSSILVNSYTKSGGFIDPFILDDASSRLSDIETVSPKYYQNAISSVALELILGYPDGTFAPKEYANRAQAAIVSYRLLVKLGIITDLTLPENIILSKNKLQQGDLLKIDVHHITSGSEISLVQDLYPEFKWYDSNDLIQGYIPTNYNTKPGVYSLKFTNTKTGRTSTRNIEILPRDFKVQYLSVSTSIESSTRTDAANVEYRKYFNPSRDISSPVRYYSEPFILPTKGRLTTEFGESRSVNGSLTSYRHAGIDIAAPTSTNVLATNTGKVTLAMPLILTGNSIVVDHGEGLFSVYFHLDKLFVSKGEMVMRGQLIGAVGSTGFSTGPHLHFTMSHYRINIEPGYIIYGQSITKANYLDLMK